MFGDCLSREYVTKEFCDERTCRIEEKIESVKKDIIDAINNHNPPMSWQAKATIIASTIMSVTSIVVALINCFA